MGVFREAALREEFTSLSGRQVVGISMSLVSISALEFGLHVERRVGVTFVWPLVAE